MNIELLKKISETPGVSGFEKPIRELIISEIKDVVDSIEIDNMGNLIAFRKGRGDKRVMVAAHMDEIGFIVSRIDDEGFVKFLPLGGFDPKTLTAQRVIVHGKKDLIGVMGTKPIHLMTPDERGKKIEIKDFFIDLGLSKSEVEAWVEVGNPISRERDFIEMGNCFNGKSLDNRISVFVLIEALKRLHQKDLPFDTYAVFTVQEEVGLRGAQVAAQKIQPDFGIALDTTIAYDVPGSTPDENISRLGNGTAIKILDATVIADYRMVRYLKQIANESLVKWQTEMLPSGGTDAGMLQKMVDGGAITGAISIPTRHIHQVIESVHRDDVANSITLLEKAIYNFDKFDLRY